MTSWPGASGPGWGNDPSCLRPKGAAHWAANHLLLTFHFPSGLSHPYAHPLSQPSSLCYTISRYEKINFSSFFPARLAFRVAWGRFWAWFFPLLPILGGYAPLFSSKFAARKFCRNNLYLSALSWNERFVARVEDEARSGGRQEAKRAKNDSYDHAEKAPLRFYNIFKVRLEYWNQNIV